MQFKHAPQNIDDYATVWVCFHEHLISCLFADLLESRGIPAKIVSGLIEHGQLPKIITEPRYFVALSPDQQRHCLVVGTPESLAPWRGNGTHTLSRPLSEEKIDTALAQLLSAH